MASIRKPRWAHLSEIDRRYHVGTPGWTKRHTAKQRRLSAWRYLHKLAPHATISAAAPRKPSSNMTTPQMLALRKKL